MTDISKSDIIRIKKFQNKMIKTQHCKCSEAGSTVQRAKNVTNPKPDDRKAK